MRLENNLEGRKFLLVLDDVWNEDRGKWIELRNLLMEGANRSKSLVSTRSPTIASMMGTMSPYNLECLPHKECLSLFVKWAFDKGKREATRKPCGNWGRYCEEMQRSSFGSEFFGKLIIFKA